MRCKFCVNRKEEEMKKQLYCPILGGRCHPDCTFLGKLECYTYDVCLLSQAIYNYLEGGR